MKSLIDADIVGYRCAASAEAEPEDIAILRVDKLMRDILYLTESETYEAYLTGPNNFRKKIYPEYKANRKDKPKPIHLQACRQFLIEEWNAVVSNGCEADDLLGVAQIDDTTCICSIDKDLLQIPGKHYNWVTYTWTDVTEFTGIKHFYEQLLKGDKTDNIPGLVGIGPKKASALLDGCQTEQEFFDACREKYNNDGLMLLYGKLLWIWRSQNDIWSPSQLIGQSHFDLGEEEMYGSIMPTTPELNLCTGPTTLATNGYPVHGL